MTFVENNNAYDGTEFFFVWWMEIQSHKLHEFKYLLEDILIYDYH